MQGHISYIHENVRSCARKLVNDHGYPTSFEVYCGCFGGKSGVSFFFTCRARSFSPRFFSSPFLFIFFSNEVGAFLKICHYWFQSTVYLSLVLIEEIAVVDFVNCTVLWHFIVLHFWRKSVNRVESEGMAFACMLQFLEDLIRRDTCLAQITTRSKETTACDACHWIIC